MKHSRPRPPHAQPSGEWARAPRGMERRRARLCRGSTSSRCSSELRLRPPRRFSPRTRGRVKKPAHLCPPIKASQAGTDRSGAAWGPTTPRYRRVFTEPGRSLPSATPPSPPPDGCRPPAPPRRPQPPPCLRTDSPAPAPPSSPCAPRPPPGRGVEYQTTVTGRVKKER